MNATDSGLYIGDYYTGRPRRRQNYRAAVGSDLAMFAGAWLQLSALEPERHGLHPDSLLYIDQILVAL